MPFVKVDYYVCTINVWECTITDNEIIYHCFQQAAKRLEDIEWVCYPVCVCLVFIHSCFSHRFGDEVEENMVRFISVLYFHENMSLQFIYFSSDCCPYAYHWQVRMLYIHYIAVFWLQVYVWLYTVCVSVGVGIIWSSSSTTKSCPTIWLSFKPWDNLQWWVYETFTTLTLHLCDRKLEIDVIFLYPVYCCITSLAIAETYRIPEPFLLGKQNFEPFLLGKHKMLNLFFWGNTKFWTLSFGETQNCKSACKHQ